MFKCDLNNCTSATILDTNLSFVNNVSEEVQDDFKGHKETDEELCYFDEVLRI
jgi:hypothetical protein